MTSLNDRQIDLKGVYPMGIGSGSVHFGSMPRQNAEEITPTDGTEFEEPSILYIGTAGDLTVVPFGGSDPVTFADCPAGWLDRLEVKKVMSTDTTATGIVRVY